MLDTRLLGTPAVLVLALASGACGTKADSSGDAAVPEVSAAGVPDVPAASGGDDADTRELARYQLTMANVRKLGVAQEKLKKLMDAQPKTADDDDDDERASIELSFDEMEAQIERLPGARKAIEDAGLSVREYTLISFALLQSSLAEMLIDQGQKADSVVRELSIHPSNLRFVKENKAELAKYQQLFQQ